MAKLNKAQEKRFDEFAEVQNDGDMEYFGWSYDGVEVPTPKEFKQHLADELARQLQDIVSGKQYICTTCKELKEDKEMDELPNKLSKSQNKRIRKRLRKAYDLAASTDDRSDVECLIDACIWELSRQKKEIIEEFKTRAAVLASPDGYVHYERLFDTKMFEDIQNRLDEALGKTIKKI